MNDLSPEARALLELASGEDSPSREDRVRVRRALAVLVQRSEERMMLGEINRSRCAEMYDLHVMVDRYRDLYSEVIGVRKMSGCDDL